jgi:hypothetical protein
MTIKGILIDTLLSLDRIKGGKDSKSPVGFTEYQYKMRAALGCTRRIAWAAKENDKEEMEEQYRKLKEGWNR